MALAVGHVASDMTVLWWKFGMVCSGDSFFFYIFFSSKK